MVRTEACLVLVALVLPALRRDKDFYGASSSGMKSRVAGGVQKPKVEVIRDRMIRMCRTRSPLWNETVAEICPFHLLHKYTKVVVCVSNPLNTNQNNGICPQQQLHTPSMEPNRCIVNRVAKARVPRATPRGSGKLLVGGHPTTLCCRHVDT